MLSRLAPSSPAARAALLSLAIAGAVPGCGLFYRNRYAAERFTIYSDLHPAFLERIGPEVKEIYQGYQDLFQIPDEKLGRTAIILKGDLRDQEVVDMAYSPNLLGYYIPFLNLISVDTKPAWTREQSMLRQILLHEISHHFIVTQFPSASKECWLNEGLAGNLEVTVFEDGRFEYPLLNPVLLGIARHSVLIDPDSGNLKKLLSLGWSEFHGDSQKELDYALSWAIVYYLLDRYLPQDIPLGRRIEMLYHLDRDVVAALEPRWLDFLRTFDLTGTLIAMARSDPGAESGKLTARWAVRELGTLKFLDSSRAVAALVDLFNSPDSVLRVHAGLAFLKVLAREPHPAWGGAVLERGREQISSRLLDRSEPVVLREVLASGLGDALRADPSWIPVFIELLDAPEPELRVAAAHGLGGTQTKPTIVNPTFWRTAEVSARTAEVDEWKTYWTSHQRELGFAR